MRYRIVEKENDSFAVVTEDGGYTFLFQENGNWVSEYYQNRLFNGSYEVVMEYLQEGNMYRKEWTENPSAEILIKDALNWLVISTTDVNFEESNDIWTDLFL